MKLTEAQKLSPHKTAVWGNEAMKDIIWPENSDGPLWWLVNGYVSLNPPPARLKQLMEGDKWSPIDEPNWKIRHAKSRR